MRKRGERRKVPQGEKGGDVVLEVVEGLCVSLHSLEFSAKLVCLFHHFARNAQHLVFLIQTATETNEQRRTTDLPQVFFFFLFLIVKLCVGQGERRANRKEKERQRTKKRTKGGLQK